MGETLADSHGLFGSYFLLKKVFTDDLGHLFRAALIEEGELGGTVWLRVLDGPGVPKEAVCGAFEHARSLASSLSASQLPANAFFIEEDGVPGLGFDHVPGQPLNRVLERARDEAFPLQPDNSLLIVEKIALALSTGEGRGRPVPHGFLHPGLVHISNDGETALSGFGVGGALLGALNDPEALAGGRAYLAPEVLSGGPPSPEADVYSLGAILFHLLTGTALPVEPADRPAALTAAHTAWDGEPLPEDIRSVLTGALAIKADQRLPSADVFRSELDRLLYGGAYSPTTFNLALFMDRLFRSEIEADEIDMESERGIDPTPYLPVPDEPEAEPAEEAPSVPEAVAPEPASEEEGQRPKTVIWAIAGGAAVIAVVAAVFWLGRESGPTQPPVPPTPTAEEIAAARQAQDDRLRALTQEMVQQMMAEREAEIRDELITRQARIEELQRRLQQSERRAAASASAAADEAATQKALMEEIKQQEEAQRAQQDALEAERQQAIDKATEQATQTAAEADPTVIPSPAAPAQDQPATTRPTPEPTIAVPTPSPTPAEIELPPKKAEPKFSVGDFVPPDQVDVRPVVLKSQSLEWPRNAARSKGRGVVVVQLTVNASGGVDDVVVLRADHTGWGIPEAALEAAAGYRFKPGTKDGVAISTYAFVTWRYDFTVQ